MSQQNIFFEKSVKTVLDIINSKNNVRQQTNVTIRVDGVLVHDDAIVANEFNNIFATFPDINGHRPTLSHLIPKQTQLTPVRRWL